MIEGDGFFVTRAGTEQLYTRAGSFQFDANGKLVTPDGSVLQGWMADATGTINSNGPITDLSVPYGQVVAPKATGGVGVTAGSMAGNLDADAPVGTVVQTAVTMYDDLGVPQDISYTYTNTGPGAWDLSIDHKDGTNLLTTSVTFDAAGNLTSPGTETVPSAALAGYPSWPGPLDIDLSKVTQFGGDSTVEATGQNGYALGTLQSFTLGNDGTITGVYSNGLRQSLGQLCLASFNNPGGLEKAGNSSFRVGDNSGVAMIGLAGVAGRGVLNSGALEMSNVDLAEEFTGLIVAQRGFQANSRVITASDEILQDLVNLKR
jgi:flagellar hook protein FlgE